MTAVEAAELPGLASSSSTRARTVDNRLVGVFVAFAVAVLTWPIAGLEPNDAPGLFTVGLHLAAAHGLRFGHDVVFTYGPLGFLTFPSLVTTWTAAAAVVYTLIANTALALTVLLVVRRSSGWPVAIAAAVAATLAPLPLADVPVLIVFAGAAWVLTSVTPPRLVVAAAGGLLAAFELLVKANDGLLCLVLALIAAAWVRPGAVRASAVTLASFAVSTVALWIATGNRLGDLATWLRLSAHLVGSYSQGMQSGPPSPPQLAPALVLAGALAALTLVAARRHVRARVIPLVLIVALTSFAYFKEGFVRYDAAHTPIFFAALVIVALALPWPNALLRLCGLVVAALAAGRLGTDQHDLMALLLTVAAWIVVTELRSTLMPPLALFAAVGAAFTASFRHDASLHSVDPITVVAAGTLLALAVADKRRLLLFAACAAVVATVASVASAPKAIVADIYRVPGPASLVEQTHQLVDPTARRNALAVYRADWRDRYVISPALVNALRGRSVDVEPWGAPIAWAYGFRWQPEPLLESYAAYDRALDDFAAAGVSNSGAERIVQPAIWASIDRQNPAWQAPSLVLAELCNYRQLIRRGRYEILGRDPGRCGSPDRLATVSARAGEWVAVPRAAPGRIVYASLHVGTGTANRIRSLLYKPRSVSVEVPGQVFKLVPGTAADRLVMRLPPHRGLPRLGRKVDFDRFRLEGVTGGATVTFFSMPVRAG